MNPGAVKLLRKTQVPKHTNDSEDSTQHDSTTNQFRESKWNEMPLPLWQKIIQLVMESAHSSDIDLKNMRLVSRSLETLVNESITYLETNVLETDGCTFKEVSKFIETASNLKRLVVNARLIETSSIDVLVDLKFNLIVKVYGNESRQCLSLLKFIPVLKGLDLNVRSLSVLPFPLKALHNVTQLSLSTETLTAEDLVNLLGIRTQLDSMKLTLTNTNGKILNYLCKLKFPLIKLSVTMRSFDTDGSLELCSGIKKLTIISTKDLFPASELVCLRSLTKLEELNIHGCADWTFLFPILAEHCPNLTSLTIERTYTKSNGFSGISRLSSLRNLYLRFCPFLDTLGPIKKLENLINLQVVHCPFIEESIDAIIPSS